MNKSTTAKETHTGMLGDGTEEQNLNQHGHPELRIEESEVDTAFSRNLLYSAITLGKRTLRNRIVMAPMTRNRAIGNVPNDLMMEYYAQRASAGLIVTEGTSPSPNGLGYPRIPGIFSAEQVEGWKKVTDAVHKRGGTIFVQLMHCGRIGNQLNLPADTRILGPSAVAAVGEIYTDAKGLQPNGIPEAMTQNDIDQAIAEFVQAAKNAVMAGFDGIELHGANGYLLEQFLRPNSNKRTDKYGGSIENRARFVLQVTKAVIAEIGQDRVGIRLSPFGVFNDMAVYPMMEADYAYLAQCLNDQALLYVHLVDHSSMGAPPVPPSVKVMFRDVFRGRLILSGGYDEERAESDLAIGKCNLIAVGRPFLANPDLIKRWKSHVVLNPPAMSTFYTPGPKGYTDYPTFTG